MSGTRISRYEIRAPAGAGGMGEVYVAQDTQLQRTVALKLLPAEFALSAERLNRFQQEAFAASALNHPSILTIYEIGYADERHAWSKNGELAVSRGISAEDIMLVSDFR